MIMAKQRKDEIELRNVRREINRIDSYYSGQWGLIDDSFKSHISKKLADLRKNEQLIMERLGYV